MLLRWCLGSLELSAATKPAPASSSTRWQTIFDLQVRLMKVEPQVLLGLSSECLNERRCPELRRGQLAIKVVASVWLSSTPAPAQCGYHTWNCTQCGYHTKNCTRSFRQHLRGAARLPITHSHTQLWTLHQQLSSEDMNMEAIAVTGCEKEWFLSQLPHVQGCQVFKQLQTVVLQW